MTKKTLVLHYLMVKSCLENGQWLQQGSTGLSSDRRKVLALNNGATFSASIGAIAVYDAARLYHLANISLSMTLEALQGLSAAFDSRIHQARGQIGQIQCAEEILKLIKGSTLNK